MAGSTSDSENPTGVADDDAPAPVSFADIAAAGERIAEGVKRTPAYPAPHVSKVAGCDIAIKFEIFQFTASFKERGALNRLLQLTAAERQRGVITVSAGNHAQALAYHAGRLGIPATVVMPRTTAFTKVSRAEELGARVILAGETFAEAAEQADRTAASEGQVFVPPFDDPAIIAGQGTVAQEFLADFPDLDMLVVPVGGGGLIAGCAIAARHANPDIRIFGVQSACYPTMKDAVGGRPPRAPQPTIADGIAVKTPGKLTRPVVERLVEDIILVEDGDIERAICLLTELEHVVAEGAAAATLAAVLVEPERFRGKRVGLVLSGANIDSRVQAGCLMRGLLRDGRMVRLYVKMEDIAGSLAKVAGVIGQHGGNILEVLHHRMSIDITARYTGIEILVETKDRAHTTEISGALEAAGFHVILKS